MVANRVQRTERGVSLIETLVALFILSVVGVAAIAGIYTTVKSNEVARTQITAESLARTELEFVSSQPYVTTALDYTLTLPTDHPSYPTGWDQTHTMPEGYTNYSIRVYAGDNVPGEESSIRKITADVFYNTTKVLGISTYLSE